MSRTYYILALVVAIILLAMFFLGNAYAQEVEVGEITVTSSTVANILPVNADMDYLTSLPVEGEAWRADRIAVLVDAETVGQEPFFQPDSLLLADLDSLSAAITEAEQLLTEQQAIITAQDDQIALLMDSVEPLESTVDSLEARIVQYEDLIALARASIGQFQQRLRDFE